MLPLRYRLKQNFPLDLVKLIEYLPSIVIVVSSNPSIFSSKFRWLILCIVWHTNSIIILLYLLEIIYNLLSFLWMYVYFFDIPFSLSVVSKLFRGELFDTFIVLSAILLPMKLSGSYSFCWIDFLKLFEMYL